MQKLADLGEFAQRSQQLHHAHQCAAHAQVNSHAPIREGLKKDIWKKYGLLPNPVLTAVDLKYAL